jgi:hypothetical protein
MNFVEHENTGERRMIKIICLTFVLTALPSFPVLASDLLSFNMERSVFKQGFDEISALLNKGTFLIKRGQPYDESKDPVLQTGGPEGDGPQHGYFAVPMIVLGLAGVLLYLSKNN